MIQYGDRHNFGQQVKPIERASGTWFQKPRSVFWEHLFFGRKSPLKKYFSKNGENGQTHLSSYFFNLEIELQDSWMGYSEKIDSSCSKEKGAELFYSFGALLAYAYFFGIQDLHKFNVIETESHLQVIDAEAVLTNLTLPNETLLLPFKSVNFTQAAIGHLVSSYAQLTDEQCRSIFCGYFDISDIFLKNFTSLQIEMANMCLEVNPIRIILRNTSDYTEMLRENYIPNELLSEETIQLQRNDVPYFFKFINDPGIYWMQNRDKFFCELQSASPLTQNAHRHAQRASIILGSEDIIEKKMFAGALFLIKKIDRQLNCEVKFQSNELVIQSDGLRYPKKDLHIGFR